MSDDQITQKFLISATNVYDKQCSGKPFWCYHVVCPICEKLNRVAYVQTPKIESCFEDLCGHINPTPNKKGDFVYSAKGGDPLFWDIVKSPNREEK